MIKKITPLQAYVADKKRLNTFSKIQSKSPKSSFKLKWIRIRVYKSVGTSITNGTISPAKTEGTKIMKNYLFSFLFTQLISYLIIVYKFTLKKMKVFNK